MSIASLPLAYDYSSSHGDITRVQQSSMWTYCASRFFQAYLTAFVFTFPSTAPGSFCLTPQYRVASTFRVNWLTGWVHHSVYVLTVEYAIRMNWTHILFARHYGGTSLLPKCPFPQSFIFTIQIPTFVLAIATINPNLRSDVLFATTFFLARITLHIRLGLSFFLQRARLREIDGARDHPVTCILVFRGASGDLGSEASKGRRNCGWEWRSCDEMRTPTGLPTTTPSTSVHTSAFTSPSPRTSTLSRRCTTLRLAMRKRWDQFRHSRASRHIGEM
ncbi:hypothetical protein EDC04DRAFT_2901829 [Pisolithus marmoratus]|nr:hypothetical protein EDC04DRAFT_2901829 [Pisolithus marmoratus]